jgi:hypothetical protein
MEQKKILYIMHIPWGWIKQRPHFIAEYLSNDFAVDVKHRKSNKFNCKHLINKISKQKKNIKINGYRLISFDIIPFLKQFKLNWINNIIFHIYINQFKKYHYVWITSPILYQYLPNLEPKTKLVYDCMDDFLEFPIVKSNPCIANNYFKLERKLILNADIVFCSSSHLKAVLQSRYNTRRDIYIVNNAINIYEDRKCVSAQNKAVTEIIKCFQNPFIYIGTISEWFDFDSVITLLNDNVCIDVLLFGPVGYTAIPKHNRLHLMGAIEHECIYEVMKCAKALIMPFKINDLILSVNPVKLYEYIYSGKSIVATRYKETEKFSDYIFLYKNTDDFIKIANSIVDGKIRNFDEKKMRNYALQNTWSTRYEQIKKYL